MIQAQKSFQNYIPGFKFNLGFCGAYYEHGLLNEIRGDRLLVANADKFNWFGHTYKHLQPHKIAYDKLLSLMIENKKFAKVSRNIIV